MGSTIRDKASLILKSCEASSVDTFNTNFYWNNIDLRLILGDTMYNKYDNFNLSLVEIAIGLPTITTTAYGATTDDRLVDINIGGLSLLRSGYSILNKSIKPYSVITPYYFSGSLTASVYAALNIDSTGLNFSKDEQVDINIFYTRANMNSSSNYTITQSYTAALPVTPCPFPPISFYFKISGVDNDLLTVRPSPLFK